MNVNKIEISLYDVHKQAIISKKASMGEKKRVQMSQIITYTLRVYIKTYSVFDEIHFSLYKWMIPYRR